MSGRHRQAKKAVGELLYQVSKLVRARRAWRIVIADASPARSARSG